MSNLKAILAQYEQNKKQQTTSSQKNYDLTNYFSPKAIDKKVSSAKFQIRILPTSDGSSPFVAMEGHSYKVGKDWKVFPCLKHEEEKPCPFCEVREELLKEAKSGKEESKELAKKYSHRKYYIVKVIDRNKEEEGVKFWRFPHSYKGDGIFDKIMDIIINRQIDITDPEEGVDLIISVGRDAKGYAIITSILDAKPSPLNEDKDLAEEWLSDNRTWRDVYAVKPYDFLEIVIKGGTPTWDKEKKCYVDKDTMDSNGDSEDEEDDDAALREELGKMNKTTETESEEEEEEEEKEEPKTKKTTTTTSKTNKETVKVTEPEEEEEEDDDLPF
jgi:hypothetical protein